MRTREVIADGSGTITVHRAGGLVFDSGHDFALLQACRRIGYFGRELLPPSGQLNVDLLLRIGSVTRCHVLDVQADDPADFRFTFYGTEASIAEGQFRHCRIGDHGSPLLRRYAYAEYARIKATGVPDLSQLDVELPGLSTSFRRLILPFGEGGKVTHFLILFVPDLGEVGERPAHHKIAAVR